METAIIGLPLAGKTTFFNALTGRNEQTRGFVGSSPASSGEGAGLADAEVPDERIDRLSRLFRPRRSTPASVRLRDIQVQFSADRGLALSTIGDLRSCDALTLVVRAFDGQAVPHPLERVDPAADLSALVDSLVFSDYEVAQRRMERLEKEGRGGEREHVRLSRIIDRLENGSPLGREFLTEEDRALFSGFSFLTAKPILVVANTGSRSPNQPETASLEERAGTLGWSCFRLQGLAEMEIAQLPAEDQAEFLGDMGLDGSARERFLTAMYEQLNLISFLTAGEDEVRAWSIVRGTEAAPAAGKIHSDLERGFIRAEVVRWRDLLEAGGFAQAKANGKMHLEGKRYVVQDGDVLTIRFNVKGGR